MCPCWTPRSRATTPWRARSESRSCSAGSVSPRRSCPRATRLPLPRAGSNGARVSSWPATPPSWSGWGGFKGPPEDGVVELGYEIAEARQGAGLATAATRAMLEESFVDDRVIAVIAHTLAERNASNRVLEKAGFSFDGEADEDGESVWRWRLARVDAAANRP